MNIGLGIGVVMVALIFFGLIYYAADIVKNHPELFGKKDRPE